MWYVAKAVVHTSCDSKNDPGAGESNQPWWRVPRPCVLPALGLEWKWPRCRSWPSGVTGSLWLLRSQKYYEYLWMTLQKEQDPAGLVACPWLPYLLDIWVCKSFLSFFAYESAVTRTTRCTDRHKIDGWRKKGSTGSLAFGSITIIWREAKLKTVRVVLMIRFFNISLMGSLALSTKPIQSHT